MSTPFPIELQRLWRGLQRQPWTTLVVVPAHPEGSGLSAARAILEARDLQSDAGPLHLLDATAVDESSAPGLVREMKARAAQGRVVVALGSPLTRPAGRHLAAAADSALLAVTLGDTDLDSARRTLELIGQERFLGSVTLPSEGKK